MEKIIDLPAAINASREAEDRLQQFSESLPVEAWPPYHRNLRFVNASVVYHVADSISREERGKLIRVWNEWIESEALLRQVELEDSIAELSSPSNPIVSAIFTGGCVVSAPLIGGALSGWMGVGLGIVMALMFLELARRQQREDQRITGEYYAKKNAALNSKKSILGWKLHKETGRFIRDIVPWNCQHICLPQRGY